MVDRADVVAAHRQLREASDAVQHLLVVEELTQQQIDDDAIVLPAPTSKSKTSTRQALRELPRTPSPYRECQYERAGSSRQVIIGPQVR